MRRRKWRWLIAATMAVVAAVGLIGWYFWLPSYRPSLEHGESYGIDVSEHQGQINWAGVGHAHLRFVYIKATEGSSYVDADFSRNLAAARSVGLSVGAYHFFTLCSPGAAQAANLLRVAPPGSTMLPVAVDLELPGNCSSRPSLTEVETELTAFVEAVRSATHQPVIFYVGTSFEHRYQMATVTNGLRWKRSILRRPSEPWVIWQVDGFAHIDGISGSVDLDVMRMGDIHTPT